MFLIDPLSRTPVYEQIIEQMQRLIETGVLHAGDQLPSVRSLSVKLRINPNTIQKSYAELDARGLIQSVPGKGCFVSRDALHLLQTETIKRLPEFTTLARELLSAGIDKEVLIDAIRQIPHPTNEKENES